MCMTFGCYAHCHKEHSRSSGMSKLILQQTACKKQRPLKLLVRLSWHAPSCTWLLRPRSTAGLAATCQAAAPLQGRGVADPSAFNAAGLIAGRNAGLLAGVPDPLELEVCELPSARLRPGMPTMGSTPQRFHTAIRSRSSAVSVDAFFISLCFFLFSFRASALAADTIFCASFILLRAVAICRSMSMVALRWRFAGFWDAALPSAGSSSRLDGPASDGSAAASEATSSVRGEPLASSAP